MTREITQRELRNESGDIMRQLDRGESFVVTRNGVAVGELNPLRRRRFASVAAVIEIFAAAPRIEYERFRADLDAVVDQIPHHVAEERRRPRGILDTSVIIDLDRLDLSLLPVEVAVSCLTIAELTAGPHATADPVE